MKRNDVIKLLAVVGGVALCAALVQWVSSSLSKKIDCNTDGDWEDWEDDSIRKEFEPARDEKDAADEKKDSADISDKDTDGKDVSIAPSSNIKDDSTDKPASESAKKDEKIDSDQTKAKDQAQCEEYEECEHRHHRHRRSHEHRNHHNRQVENRDNDIREACEAID